MREVANGRELELATESTEAPPIPRTNVSPPPPNFYRVPNPVGGAGETHFREGWRGSVFSVDSVAISLPAPRSLQGHHRNPRVSALDSRDSAALLYGIRNPEPKCKSLGAIRGQLPGKPGAEIKGRDDRREIADAKSQLRVRRGCRRHQGIARIWGVVHEVRPERATVNTQCYREIANQGNAAGTKELLFEFVVDEEHRRTIPREVAFLQRIEATTLKKQTVAEIDREVPLRGKPTTRRGCYGVDSGKPHVEGPLATM